jgi:hypothetical protein
MIHNDINGLKNLDQIIVCKPERCNCGRNLSQGSTTILSHRQEFDLPKPRLEVIEYQLAQTETAIQDSIIASAAVNSDENRWRFYIE